MYMYIQVNANGCLRSVDEMTWIIVGAVLGAVVLAIAVAVIVWCVYKKRQCNRKDTKGECFK